MNNEQLRRTCMRVLMNHLTRSDEDRPVALGGKLARSDMTMDDVAKIWARLGDELHRRGAKGVGLVPSDWGPVREMLSEYHAVMRERLHPERKRGGSRPHARRVAERRACE